MLLEPTELDRPGTVVGSSAEEGITGVEAGASVDDGWQRGSID